MLCFWLFESPGAINRSWLMGISSLNFDHSCDLCYWNSDSDATTWDCLSPWYNNACLSTLHYLTIYSPNRIFVILLWSHECEIGINGSVSMMIIITGDYNYNYVIGVSRQTKMKQKLRLFRKLLGLNAILLSPISVSSIEILWLTLITLQASVPISTVL